MPQAENLRNTLISAIPDMPINGALPRYLSGAPDWLDPEADKWNIAPLHRRSNLKIWTLDFTQVSHRELRAVARAYALWQIVERQVAPGAIRGAFAIFVFLGEQLSARPLRTLKSEDFHLAERRIVERYSSGSSARMCSDLQQVGSWLNRYAGFRIDYKNMRRAPAVHGSAATDEARNSKLLPDEIIADLLAARRLPDLSARDRLFLATIAISVATGFRLIELLTLPEDCLIRDGGALMVRSFVSKRGKAAPRPVPPELAEIVVDAVDYIRDVTAPARAQAQGWAENAPIDWIAILRDEDTTALEYFVRRWLAEWIDDPGHRMIDARWAYFSFGERSQWVPLADLLEKHGGNVSAVARDLGLGRSSVTKLVRQIEASRRGQVYTGTKSAGSRRAFDTDRRFPSVTALGKLVGLSLANSPRNALLLELIDEAREAQLAQCKFRYPLRDQDFEDQYRLIPDVLNDPATGEATLSLHEALFVTYRNQFSSAHEVDTGRVGAVSKAQFNHWLAGYGRDRGTGLPGDAVCARLGIVDPRTDQPAKFSNHDFRHWLETAYENGGLSQTQIATLFNRSFTNANSGYDQTDSKVRRARLKDAMADGLLIGHAAVAYARIAEDSPDEAASYLEAATKFQNPMPHGICRLNWALEPCPHALSCFSCGDAQDSDADPCEHLIVDVSDEAQSDEIARINRNAASIVRIMSEDGAEDGPQFDHFQRIARSTRGILAKAGRA